MVTVDTTQTTSYSGSPTEATSEHSTETDALPSLTIIAPASDALASSFGTARLLPNPSSPTQLLGQKRAREEEEPASYASPKSLQVEVSGDVSPKNMLADMTEVQHETKRRRTSLPRMAHNLPPPPTAYYPSTKPDSPSTSFTFAPVLLPSKTERPTTSQKIHMVLEEGFIEAPADKAPGGKDNRRPIIPQVIAIDTTTLPERHLSKLNRLAVKATVMGFKRLSVAREEMELAVVEKITLERGTHKQDAPTILLITFEAIVVHFSSHNNGQKLFIRFSLIDLDQNSTELCKVDTAEFETITKRGIEKKIKKMKKSESPGRRSPISAVCTASTSSTITPTSPESPSSYSKSSQPNGSPSSSLRSRFLSDDSSPLSFPTFLPKTKTEFDVNKSHPIMQDPSASEAIRVLLSLKYVAC